MFSFLYSSILRGIKQKFSLIEGLQFRCIVSSQSLQLRISRQVGLATILQVVGSDHSTVDRMLYILLLFYGFQVIIPTVNMLIEKRFVPFSLPCFDGGKLDMVEFSIFILQSVSTGK